MPNPNTYIPLDPWVASSLLQKAIRRGATDHALRAAHEFHRHRGSGIWRRLELIAFEDIGIGDLELVQRITMLAADHAYRESFGHERELIEAVVTRMAATPKDRSADYLICTAHDGRDVDAFRDDSRSRPRAERAAIAADAFTSLEKRAVAACTAVEIGYGTKFSAGEPLLELLDAFFEEWSDRFAWVRPRAGSIGFPRLTVPGVRIDDFAADLVQAEGVLLLPGSQFGYPGNHFRLGFGRTDLPKALARLESFAHRTLR